MIAINKSTPAREIMSTDLITIDKDENLHAVEEKFDKYNIHHLPVIENGQIIGMISQGDLLLMKDWGTNLKLRRSLFNNQEILRTHTAEDIMSNKLVYVQEDTTIHEIAELLKDNKYHAFPVLRLGQLVGMVSSYDIIQKAFS